MIVLLRSTPYIYIVCDLHREKECSSDSYGLKNIKNLIIHWSVYNYVQQNHTNLCSKEAK